MPANHGIHVDLTLALHLLPLPYILSVQSLTFDPEHTRLLEVLMWVVVSLIGEVYAVPIPEDLLILVKLPIVNSLLLVLLQSWRGIGRYIDMSAELGSYIVLERAWSKRDIIHPCLYVVWLLPHNIDGIGEE